MQTAVLNQVIYMNLSIAEEGKEYIIQRIETDDEELDDDDIFDAAELMGFSSEDAEDEYERNGFNIVSGADNDID